MSRYEDRLFAGLGKYERELDGLEDVELIVFDDDSVECAECHETFGPGPGAVLRPGQEVFGRAPYGECKTCGRSRRAAPAPAGRIVAFLTRSATIWRSAMSKWRKRND